MTEITTILDRSGSMASVASDAIGGFNTFLASQQAHSVQENDPATFSLILFDHEYTPVHLSRPIAEIPPLTDQTFIPRGNTALLDAIGRTLTDLGQRIASQPVDQRPTKVIITILTDGQENASRSYSQEQIRQMITHHRELLGWEFIFLAANQDAFAGAQNIGIDRDDAVCFEATSQGTADVMAEKSRRVSEKRRQSKQ